MIGGVGDIGEEGQVAKLTRRSIGRTIRVDPPPVGVLSRRARPPDSRVGFDVARETGSLGANITAFDHVVLTQRPLERYIPVLRIRRLRILRHAHYACGRQKGVRLRPWLSAVRIYECGAWTAELHDLRPRRRADRPLD